jgi:ribosome-associated protein
MTRTESKTKLSKDYPLDVCSVVINACNDAKAKDLVVLETSGLSDLFTYQIIISANSDRQVQGIAARIVDSLETEGHGRAVIEGLETGHWVAIDCGDVMAHVFYGPIREHYNLEGLWTKAPRLKLVEQKTGVSFTKV